VEVSAVSDHAALVGIAAVHDGLAEVAERDAGVRLLDVLPPFEPIVGVGRGLVATTTAVVVVSATAAGDGHGHGHGHGETQGNDEPSHGAYLPTRGGSIYAGRRPAPGHGGCSLEPEPEQVARRSATRT
jgi:hypothetical protein